MFNAICNGKIKTGDFKPAEKFSRLLGIKYANIKYNIINANRQVKFFWIYLKSENFRKFTRIRYIFHSYSTKTFHNTMSKTISFKINNLIEVINKGIYSFYLIQCILHK